MSAIEVVPDSGAYHCQGKPSEYVWLHVCGQPRRERDQVWMLVLQTAFDESYDGVPDHSFVVAGYLASVEGWANFSDEWQAALDKTPPMHSPFKMKHYANDGASKARFFTREELLERLNELVDIVQRNTLVGVYSIVRKDEYEKIVAPNAHPCWKTPYSYCYSDIVKSALFWVKEHRPDAKVEVIFDQAFEKKRALETVYRSLLLSVPPQLRNVFVDDKTRFCDDRTFRPLQAADLLAWHVRNSRDTGQDHTVSAKLCDGPLKGNTWTAPYLAKVIEGSRILQAGGLPQSIEGAKEYAEALWDQFYRMEGTVK